MFKTYFRKSSIVRYQPTDQKLKLTTNLKFRPFIYYSLLLVEPYINGFSNELITLLCTHFWATDRNVEKASQRLISKLDLAPHSGQVFVVGKLRITLRLLWQMKQEGGKKSPSGEVALRQLQFEFPLSASWGLEMLDLAMWNLKS